MATSGPYPSNPKSGSPACSTMPSSSTRRALAPWDVRSVRLSISLRTVGVDGYARSAAAERAALPRPAGSSVSPSAPRRTQRQASALKVATVACSSATRPWASRSPSSRRATQSSATAGSSSTAVKAPTSRAAASSAVTSLGMAATTGLAASSGWEKVGVDRCAPTTSRASPSYGENGSRGSARSVPST